MRLFYLKTPGKKKKTYCFLRLPGEENFGLKEWFSKCAPWRSSTHITWDLSAMPTFWAPTQMHRLRHSGRGPGAPGFTDPPGDSKVYENLRTTQLNKVIITLVRLTAYSQVERNKQQRDKEAHSSLALHGERDTHPCGLEDITQLPSY